MAKSSDSRATLIKTAAALFQRQGYHGTGLTQILQESGTAKGSFYFYFPEGKEQLAAAAIEQAGAEFAMEIEKVLSKYTAPDDAVLAMGRALSRWLEKSGFVNGCPITTVCLEMVPASEQLTAVVQKIFQTWQGQWRAHLMRGGISAADAELYATLIVTSFEGAFVVSRAEKSRRAFDMTGEVLAKMLKTTRR